MSWIQKLYDTYEQCSGASQFAAHPLLPVSHAVQQAHIEITLDGNGNFRRAGIVQKEETILPATERSAARTSGEAPHPLSDKIQYCASDYPRYAGKKKSYYAGYVEQLERWCHSQHAHPKAIAVLEYVRKGCLVRDLVGEKILQVDSSNALLLSPNPDLPASEIFKLLTAKEGDRDQGDAMIRWRVEAPGDATSETWKDPSLIGSWMAFDASQEQQRGFCMVTGREMTLAHSHPKRLRHAGDGAKLISSNNKGYTFRGRFTNAIEACGVGFEVTQKAHNALRWLLARERKQAFRNGDDQVIVAWCISGKSVPDFIANSAELFGLESESVGGIQTYQGDAGQGFAIRLNKYMAGYRVELGAADEVSVIALDSATPGRLAIAYYRELNGREFVERIHKCLSLRMAATQLRRSPDLSRKLLMASKTSYTKS